MRLDRRIVTFLTLTGASAFCVALVLVRARATGTDRWTWLVFNLALAWIPFLLALLVYDGHRRRLPLVALAPLAFLWLIFFPNAPYIVTDFVHLEQPLAAPLWFDALLIATAAFTGLLLGYVSLYLMQSVIRSRFGALASWLAVLAALALSSVGIYLGRFVRVNSWDLVTKPDLLYRIARPRLEDPLGNPQLIAVSVFFTAFLFVTYVVVYSLTALPRDLELHERATRR